MAIFLEIIDWIGIACGVYVAVKLSKLLKDVIKKELSNIKRRVK